MRRTRGSYAGRLATLVAVEDRPEDELAGAGAEVVVVEERLEQCRSAIAVPVHGQRCVDDTVMAYGVITDAELDAFTAAWARLEEVDEDKRHAVLSTSTQAAYDAANALGSDTRFELREALNRLVRFYGFLSQALPWIPPRTEVLYQFAKVLMKRLRPTAPTAASTSPGTWC